MSSYVVILGKYLVHNMEIRFGYDQYDSDDMMPMMTVAIIMILGKYPAMI